MNKQYIILDAKKIKNVFDLPRIQLEKTKGIFIECPHCEKLLRIDKK